MDNANKAVVELNSFFRSRSKLYGKGGLKDQLSQTSATPTDWPKTSTRRAGNCACSSGKSAGHPKFTQGTLTRVSDLLTDLQRFVAGATRFVSDGAHPT